MTFDVACLLIVTCHFLDVDVWFRFNNNIIFTINTIMFRHTIDSMCQISVSFIRLAFERSVPLSS